MDRTKELIAKAQRKDIGARDMLVQENTGLVWSIARRFTGRGQELEDLFQIGCIGLIKAIDRFDLTLDFRFSTYAVPLITGEIKRFLRDDGLIKVSRSIKENASKCMGVAEKLRNELGREPTVKEISENAGLELSDVIAALESGNLVETFDQTKEGAEQSFDDRVASEITVRELIEKLPPRSQQILIFRYYKDMTQVQVAGVLGISQVQVSRIEKKALQILKNELV